MPRVTIGLPVYNGENFVRYAIDSIRAQSFSDFELIVSDNGSIDQTSEICRGYAAADRRIRYLRSDLNRGATWNQNRVLSLAASEFVKLAAHDDLIAPDFLEKCVRALDSHPEAVLAYPLTRHIDESGRTIGDYSPDTIGFDSPRSWERFGARTSRIRVPLPFVRGRCDDCDPIFGLLRVSALRQTPLFDAHPAADHILLARLALLGPFLRIPEYLFFNRLHAGQSVQAHRGMRSQAVWWDPGAGPLSFPDWRLFWEYVRSVYLYRGRLSFHEQLRCYLKTGGYLFWNWPRLARDVVSAAPALYAALQMSRGRRPAAGSTVAYPPPDGDRLGPATASPGRPESTSR